MNYEKRKQTIKKFRGYYDIELAAAEVDNFLLFVELYYRMRQDTGEYLTDVSFKDIVLPCRYNLYHDAHKVWRNYEGKRIEMV